MNDFVSLTNEQLIKAYKDKAADMSYFNAAEGSAWHKEAVARNRCKGELLQVKNEIVSRGMEIPTGNWLL